MPGQDPHGNRDFREAPLARPSARGLWHAQHDLDRASAWPGRAQHGPQRPASLSDWVVEAQATLGGRVFRIPAGALEPLQRRIVSLARRASRLGTAPIELRDTGERDPDGHVFVILSGSPPVLAGWTLAAIVEHRDGHATARPVAELGERLDHAAFAIPRCEHCRLRRARTQTFVVVHRESGEARQVGSNCLRDFLGGNDPERACRQAEYLAVARAELAHADRPPRPAANFAEPSLERFAAHAARVVRAHGWTSREQARRGSGTASADLALRSLQASPEAPDRADRALAAAALRWARALLPTRSELSQFERDAVAAVTGRPVLTGRERGLVCALIAVYRQRRGRSRHLARPGGRLETTVVVERVTAQASRRHGTIYRCELLDADANRLMWWQTRGKPLRAGEVVRLAGRVQRHTRFGDTPVTVLSHCRRRVR
jgi:hypothetical protein